MKSRTNAAFCPEVCGRPIAATPAITAPPQTIDSRPNSLWIHQKSVGACQKPWLPNCRRHLCKELGYRLDSLFADQSSDLPSERDEGDEIDQRRWRGRRGTKRCCKWAGTTSLPQSSARNPIAGVPMRGDDPVQEFHDSGKAWQVAIQPEREGPQAAVNKRHQAEGCFGAAGSNVAVEILNRAAEVGERNVREPPGGALIGEVFDAVAGQ